MLPTSRRAKLFMNGGSQAVRLPKDCRFEGREVLVERQGEAVVLRPLAQQWTSSFLAEFHRETDESFPDVRPGPEG